MAVTKYDMRRSARRCVLVCVIGCSNIRVMSDADRRPPVM